VLEHRTIPLTNLFAAAVVLLIMPPMLPVLSMANTTSARQVLSAHALVCTPLSSNKPMPAAKSRDL
jgi:hypothetical protein